MSYYHSHFKSILDNSKGKDIQYGYYVECIKKHFDSPKTWLDIGCSRGDFVQQATNYFSINKAIGIDLDKDSISEANKIYGNKSVSFLEFDLNDYIKSTNQKFDVITCLNVLEHIKVDQFIILLRNLPKIMNKDAIFYFKVPNAGTIYNNRWLFDDVTHITYLTNRSIKQIFSIADLNTSNLDVVEDKSQYLKMIGKFRWVFARVCNLLSVFSNGLSHIKDPQTATIIGIYKNE